MQLDLLSHGADVGPGSLLSVPGSVRTCAEAGVGLHVLRWLWPVSDAPACADVTLYHQALPAADL